MTPITRYKIRKVIKYALVTTAVAWVLTLFSGEPVGAVLGMWALLGLWTGVLEEFFFRRRFRALAIPLQFLGKALLVNLLTVALIGFAYIAGQEHFRLVVAEVPDRVRDILRMALFYQLTLRVVVVTTV
ncbi:MAG: hypothetical protein ACK46C_09050, partial [Flavobacteriales bacterium]